MSYQLDLIDTSVFTALRAFILDTLGTAVTEVVRAPVNRVPAPKNYPYIIMSPLSKTEIAWPSINISDPLVQPQSESITMPTEFAIQLDAFGPTAGDIMQMLYQTIQSPNAFDFFNTYSIQGVAPIYADAPNQAPFVDGEAEYEVRWIMRLRLQYNPTLTTAVQTASQAVVGIINVEATYH